MKKMILILVLTGLAFAQTPDLGNDTQVAYSGMQAPLSALIVSYNNLKVTNTNLADYIKVIEGQIAWVKKLNDRCPTCQAAISAALDKGGAFQANVPPDSAVVYITKQP